MSHYMWDAETGEIERVPKYPIGSKLYCGRNVQYCTVAKFTTGKRKEYLLQWANGNRTGWSEEGIDNNMVTVEQNRYTKCELLDEELFRI